MENVASGRAPGLDVQSPARQQHDRTLADTPREELLGAIPFALAYAVVAVLGIFLLPPGQGFKPLGAVAVLCFIAGDQLDLRVEQGWVTCDQCAFVLMLFTLPLNAVPAIACLARIASGMLTRRPLRNQIHGIGDTWYVIPPVLVLALATQSNSPAWGHWPIYLVAFTSQCLFNSCVLWARYAVYGKRMHTRVHTLAIAVDLMLTPIGLMAAVNGRSAPVATAVMMVGLTGLLVLLSREHDGRLTAAGRALRDPLTGLPNRALFDETLSATERRCERDGECAGLLLMDLDGFKEINDTFGHPSGDQVLLEFAGRLRNAVRAADTPARLGGDEFAVILEAPMSSDELLTVAANLREALEGPVTLADGETVMLRASIGSAIFGDENEPVDALSEADQRLYADKRDRKQARV
jgi:diguanylate cyclase (GGDEF)-like protein